MNKIDTTCVECGKEIELDKELDTIVGHDPTYFKTINHMHDNKTYCAKCWFGLGE